MKGWTPVLALKKRPKIVLKGPIHYTSFRILEIFTRCRVWTKRGLGHSEDCVSCRTQQSKWLVCEFGHIKIARTSRFSVFYSKRMLSLLSNFHNTATLNLCRSTIAKKKILWEALKGACSSFSVWMSSAFCCNFKTSFSVLTLRISAPYTSTKGSFGNIRLIQSDDTLHFENTFLLCFD